MERAKIHTVLIVDDEEAVLMLLGRQLSNLPYTIIPTTSPAEAIHVLQTHEIAVLVTDLNMPEIDGNEVLHAARMQNPNIVSIVLTGREDLTATIKAINEGGIWKYVAKPWTGKEIVRLVHEGVQRYAALGRQQAELTSLAQEITANRDTIAATLGDDFPTEVPAQPRGALGALKKITFRRPALKKGGAGLGSSRYRMMEVLGEGGMGKVYKAEDLLLGMPVAIKVLGSNFTRDRNAVATLKEEARIAMQLSHRHIVRIHNLQKVGGHYFLVMEYVKGRTFREILKIYHQLPLSTVLQVVRVCSDALSYAHRHHVLHRDLKPANLMLAEDGVLKIIDFGVACLAGKQRDKDHAIGTPVYMSPEQIRGEDLDNRTDIYSLGIITYQLLTGRPPFPESTTNLDLLAFGPPPLDDLQPEVRWVIERAVAPYRGERWDSVETFAATLIDQATLLAKREAREAGETSAGDTRPG